MSIGLYCNWKLKQNSNGDIYLNSIHAKYLFAFKNKYKKVTLLSNISSEVITDADQLISDQDISFILLPAFSGYLGAIKFFPRILSGIKKLTSLVNCVYIRTPEPFSWAFSLFRNKKNINYHFISNPLDVILKKKSRKKYITYLAFLPEYYITCFAAYINNCSCNGPSVLNNVPFFLRNKLRVLIENTLSRDELEKKSYNKSNFTQPYKMVCVSRLQEAKGLPELICAFAHFSRRNKIHAELSIVGDGPLKNTLQELIIKIGAQDYIHLLGHVKNGSPLDDVYKRHQILINPSLSETGPRVILEAMSEGLVCVSTDVGYVRHVFDKNRQMSELIICGKDNFETSLEKILLKLIYEDGYYECMSLNSFNLAKRYSLDDFIEGVFCLGADNG